MAEHKKSFILYADIISLVEDLPRETKGDLFQLILDYVNDKNPQPTDLLLKTAFAPIKMQLKRDLVKWSEIREKRSEAGKASAIKRQHLLTSVESVEQPSTNPTVNVNANVTVNDNVINTDDTHSVFADRLLTIESELDKEAIEISTKKKVNKQILIEFNANLKNSNKHHSHFSEYKKHLVNWLSKKKENLTHTKKYEKL